MVHALRRLHRALVPGGALVDLRPDRMVNPGNFFAGQRRLYCLTGGRRMLAGYLRTRKPMADYLAADRAVRRVIRQGLFAREAGETFDFHYYLDSLAHLEKVLAIRWSLRVMDARTRRRLGRLLGRHPAARILAVDPMRLNVLRRKPADGR